MPLSLRKVGNRLVIGDKPARQPHHLNVAPSLVLKPPTSLNPIEIAVDVKLQQDRGMIRGSAGCFGIDPTKPKLLGQIEFFERRHRPTNRIVLADPVFQAFWKQRGLTAIDPLNEAPHPDPPANRTRILIAGRPGWGWNMRQTRLMHSPDARCSNLKIETLKEQMRRLELLKVEMLAIPDQQISLTDPDARSMATSGRGSGIVGYNVQMGATHFLMKTLPRVASEMALHVLVYFEAVRLGCEGL